MIKTSDDLVTVAEAARLTGTPKPTLYRMIRDKRVRYRTIDGLLYIFLTSVPRRAQSSPRSQDGIA